MATVGVRGEIGLVGVSREEISWRPNLVAEEKVG